VLRPHRSAPLLWALAAVLALVTARAVGSGLADLDARRRALGPPVPAVVAAVDLAAGAPATAADLRVEQVPASLRPPGALATLDDAVGQVVAVPLLAGAVVTDRHLGDGLGAAVPAGHRAVRVRADGSARPEPGAVVDVVGVVAAFDGTPEPEVVAGLTVLAIDPPSDLAPDALGVVLVVPTSDAPRLAALAAGGPVALALAPGAGDDPAGRAATFPPWPASMR
jgi:pilus assembly protein CpaB